jgi:uroporphyrinogen decarboxylase
LLGFAGSPWTLANFMMQGGSATEFTRAKLLFHTEPELFERFMTADRRRGRPSAHANRGRGRRGADLRQPGGVLAASDYEAASTSWIRAIIRELPARFP